MKKLYCDVCKEEARTVYKIQVIQHDSVDNCYTNSEFINTELCENCLNKIKDFIATEQVKSCECETCATGKICSKIDNSIPEQTKSVGEDDWRDNNENYIMTLFGTPLFTVTEAKEKDKEENKGNIILPRNKTVTFTANSNDNESLEDKSKGEENFNQINFLQEKGKELSDLLNELKVSEKKASVNTKPVRIDFDKAIDKIDLCELERFFSNMLKGKSI